MTISAVTIQAVIARYESLDDCDTNGDLLSDDQILAQIAEVESFAAQHGLADAFEAWFIKNTF